MIRNGETICNIIKQQKVKTWQPLPYLRSSVIIFLLISLIFLTIGILLFNDMKNIKEIVVEYTNCNGTNCNIDIIVNENMNGDVFFYYGLDNFYQNYRLYLKSRSDKQLLGDVMNTNKCFPYDKDNNSTPIAPCGAIANSMFNDTFQLFTNDNEKVPMTYKGIIWKSLLRKKYKNPPLIDNDLCLSFQNTTKPLNWVKNPCELDKENPNNNGFENVDFIIWMQTAALNNFRNLYRKLDRTGNVKFKNGLAMGNYTVNINNNYPVKQFNGRKYFIISTVSIFGGKNYFPPIAFLTVSGICIIFSITLIFLKYNPFLLNSISME
uniref:Transmembrane protein 30A n=1 Tax=Parastrongyloides trichosuri TaxID=131310 RepID=A0A0N4ZR79_PARTI